MQYANKWTARLTIVSRSQEPLEIETGEFNLSEMGGL